MVMNATILGNAMYAASGIASDEILEDGEKQKILDFFIDIYGTSIVDHITSLAQLSGLVVAVASVSAVTPGSGASGPGTGTATGAPGSIT